MLSSAFLARSSLQSAINRKPTVLLFVNQPEGLNYLYILSCTSNRRWGDTPDHTVGNAGFQSITAFLTPYNNLEPCHLSCWRSALLWSRLPTITSGGTAYPIHRNCLGHGSIQRPIAMAERWRPTFCSEHGSSISALL